MRIVVIYGQNNKGNTYNLTRLFIDTLGREEHTVTELFPKDYVQKFCTGCTSCFFNGENTCSHNNQVQPVVEVMDKADLLIFSSSCYVMNMTGSLKNLLDHLAYRFMLHRPNPDMFSKQAVVFSTAAGAGMGRTTKAIAINLFHWGIPVIHRYNLRVGAASFDAIEDKQKKRIKKNLESMARKIEKVKNPKPNIKTKALFWFMKQMQKGNDWNLHDKEYWQNKGWII